MLVELTQILRMRRIVRLLAFAGGDRMTRTDAILQTIDIRRSRGEFCNAP